jgi:hypothetical protein
MANLGRLNSDAIHSTGPFAFLHPTTRYHPLTVTRNRQHHHHGLLNHNRLSTSPITRPITPDSIANITRDAQEKETPQIYHVWRSRDNRKGRHRAVVTKPAATSLLRTGEGDDDDNNELLRRQRAKKRLIGLTRLVTRFPVWDVSYLVAVAFVLGLCPSLSPLPLDPLPPCCYFRNGIFGLLGGSGWLLWV